MFYKFSIRLILWHKKSIFLFQDAYFKYLWVFSRPCDSESTRSVTSKMSHISLLCFPYCRYSKTGITNICWWNSVYGMESLCTILFQTLYALSNRFSRLSLLPSHFPTMWPKVPTLKISTSWGTLVKSRTLEQDCLYPPLICSLSLRQATELLCASPVKQRN